MKSRFNLFLLLSGVLISCSDNGSFRVSDNSSDNGVITRFSATYELPGTKTVIDEVGHLSWCQGDAISIISSTNPSSPARFTTNSTGNAAEFEGKIEDGASSYWGLYPYDENSSVSSSAIYTVLNSSQLAYEGTFDPACFLAVGESKDKLIEFRNVCGGVRFSFSETGITKVVFESLDPSIHLAGNLRISISSDNVPSSSVYVDGTNKIELSCADGFKNDGTFYYITTVPVSLTDGFRFTFYKGSTLFKEIEFSSSVEIKRSIFATINDVDDESSLNKICVDLSATETANCYIVDHAGKFKFRAVKGNGSMALGSAEYAGVIWETDNTYYDISENSIVTDVEYRDGYVYFSTPETMQDGNALIAVYGGGLVLWSWHIWCCEGYDPELTSQKYNDFQGVYLDSRTMMDRNLGALSADAGDELANGLMYQWGRKDPFMGGAFNDKQDNRKMASTNPADYVDNSDADYDLIYSVRNPNTFICNSTGSSGDWLDDRDNDLWTDITLSKSIYDPCPAGWRVPTGGPFSDFSTNRNPWKISKISNGIEDFEIDRYYYGAYIPYTYTSGGKVKEEKAWYPCNGYLDKSTSELQAMGESGYYWSTTPQSGSVVYTFRIFCDNNYDNYRASSTEGGKIRAEGHSVRCIKD